MTPCGTRYEFAAEPLAFGLLKVTGLGCAAAAGDARPAVNPPATTRQPDTATDNVRLGFMPVSIADTDGRCAGMQPLLIKDSLGLVDLRTPQRLLDQHQWVVAASHRARQDASLPDTQTLRSTQMKRILIGAAVLVVGLSACSSGSTSTPASSPASTAPAATTAETCKDVYAVLDKELPNPSTPEEAKAASEALAPYIAAAGPAVKDQLTALDAAITTAANTPGGTDALTAEQKTALGNAVVALQAVCEK